MDANITDLEKKIGIKIQAVRDILLDQFSGVDRKLAVIQVLLNNIIGPQNGISNPPEKRCNVTEKTTRGTESSGVVEMGGFGGPLHEFGPMKPLQTEIPMDGNNQETDAGDRGRHEPPQEAGTSYGWLSLYTPPQPDFRMGAEKSWTGKRVAKMGQDDIFKNLSKSWTGLSGSCCKVADKRGGEEVQTHVLASWGKINDEETDILRQDDSFKNSSMSAEDNACVLPVWGKIKDEKTDFLRQDFSKTDQWAKKDSGWWGKALQRETNRKRAYVESDIGAKRKHPDSPIRRPNDGPGGQFTATKRRLNMLTADEQEVFNDVETIMKSIRRIMHQKGYIDGDLLTADDQTYILDSIFNYHPEKAQQTDSVVDYIMINKHMKFQGKRCFNIVYTNGSAEDFSYFKCLKNLIMRKYPTK